MGEKINFGLFLLSGFYSLNQVFLILLMLSQCNCLRFDKG
ncbi:hypothetical protein VCHC37A1_1155A, partial [Vibrio cholerae HC-37A1]